MTARIAEIVLGVLVIGLVALFIPALPVPIGGVVVLALLFPTRRQRQLAMLAGVIVVVGASYLIQ